MTTKSLSLCLEEDTIDRLNQIASATECDVSCLMRRAIEEFTEHEGWIIEETLRRLESVKNGTAELTSHEEVVNRFRNRKQNS